MLERSRNVKRNILAENGLNQGTIPQPKWPPAKPSDWGIGMTICIAAICAYGSHIILATDQMISAQDFSGDAITLKIISIHKTWGMMFASNDIGNVGPIVGGVQRQLEGQKQPNVQDVRTALLDAYKAQHLKKSNALLAPLDLDLETFKMNGRKILGTTIFAQYCRALEEVSLQTQFLVAGFDPQTLTPSIFEVSKLGDFISHDVTGFWAIGSGQHSALSSLFFHSFGKILDLPAAIYHVCEAKFMAESAVGVGKATSVIVMLSLIHI